MYTWWQRAQLSCQLIVPPDSWRWSRHSRRQSPCPRRRFPRNPPLQTYGSRPPAQGRWTQYQGVKKILGRLLKFEDDLLFIPVQCSWLGKYKNKWKIKGRLLRFEDDLLFLPVHGLDNTRINDKFKVVLWYLKTRFCFFLFIVWTILE